MSADDLRYELKNAIFKKTSKNVKEYGQMNKLALKKAVKERTESKEPSKKYLKIDKFEPYEH